MQVNLQAFDWQDDQVMLVDEFRIRRESEDTEGSETEAWFLVNRINLGGFLQRFDTKKFRH